MSWNANGLKEIGPLKHMLEMEAPEILCIQESKIGERNKVPSFPNYNVFFQPATEIRRQYHYGLITLVKRSIQAIEDTYIKEGRNEIQVIRLPHQNGGTKIANTYLSPSDNIPENLLIDISLDHSTIIIGDLNAKHANWGNPITDVRGKVIDNITVCTGRVLHHTPEPTRHDYSSGARHRSSTIDLLTTAPNVVVENPKTIDLTTSDHDVISFEIELPTIRSTFSSRPRFKTQDKPRIIQKLEEEFTTITNETPTNELQLNNLYDTITTKLVNITNEFKTNPRNSTINTQYNQLPPYIVELLRMKKARRRRLRGTGDQNLHQQVRDLQRLIRQEIRNWRDEQWKNKLQSSDEKTLYSILKPLRKNKPPNLAPIEHNGRKYYTEEEQGLAIAEHLTGQFTNTLTATREVTRQREETWNTIKNSNLNGIEDQVSEREVQNTIRHLKNGKAPGHDGITNELIKLLPWTAISKMTLLINGILNTLCFPKTMKHAIIITVPKPNKPQSNPANRRPISLLPVVAKLAEKVLQRRLENILNPIIPDNQIGFRPRIGTTHAITELVDFAHRGYLERQPARLVTIDLEKAFDQVEHKTLINTLVAQDINRKWIKLIQNYLQDRTFQVRTGNKITTNTYQINASVPQGSVWGPTLFNAHISGIPIPRRQHTKLIMFADDIAIATRGMMADAKLQDAINNIETWARNSNIGINPTKCQAITIRLNNPPQPPTINGQPIQYSPTIEYLGIKIDRRLSWNPQISAIKRKSSTLFKMCKAAKLHPDIGIKIFKTIIRPTLEYGSTQLVPLQPTKEKRLTSAYTIPLKKLLSIPVRSHHTHLLQELGIQHPRERKQQLAENFYQTCWNTRNEIPVNGRIMAARIIEETKKSPVDWWLSINNHPQ